MHAPAVNQPERNLINSRAIKANVLLRLRLLFLRYNRVQHVECFLGEDLVVSEREIALCHYRAAEYQEVTKKLDIELLL